MRNIEGLYSALAALIRQREDEEKLAISTRDLVESVKAEVDIYSASLDWYIQFALRAAVETSLCQMGYRSVVKGNGLFVNPANCTKPAYLARLFNNAKLSELQQKQIVAMLAKEASKKGVPGQMSIDLESGMFVEDMTEERLLEMLLADAEGTITDEIEVEKLTAEEDAEKEN